MIEYHEGPIDECPECIPKHNPDLCRCATCNDIRRGDCGWCLGPCLGDCWKAQGRTA